jgi:hypothetical protein
MRVSMKRGAIPTSCEVFANGEVEDYLIEIVDPVVSCTATIPTNLSVSNITTSSAMIAWDNVVDATYDIRYKETSNTSWITISDITSLTNTLTSLLENTEYEVQVRSKCANNTTSNYSTSEIFTTLENTSGYCNSEGLDFSEEYISMVRVDGFPHTSGANGYSDFTDTTFQVTRGETNLALVIGAFTGTPIANGYRAWIDYNNDGVFDNITELVFQKSPNTNTSQYVNINPAASVSLGVKRMRVSMKRGAIPTSCEVFANGEVEDYTINIIDPTANVSNINYFENLNIYPNPNNGKLNVSFLTSHLSDVKIQIYTNLGQIVFNNKYTKNKNNFNQKIDLSNLSNGIYLIKITDGLRSVNTIILLNK